MTRHGSPLPPNPLSRAPRSRSAPAPKQRRQSITIRRPPRAVIAGLDRGYFRYAAGSMMMMKIEEANIDGFLSPQENGGYFRYAAPCTLYGSPLPREAEGEERSEYK